MEAGGDVSITTEYLSQVTDGEWTLEQMTVNSKNYQLSGKLPTIGFNDNGRIFGLGSVNRYAGCLQIDGYGNVESLDGFASTKIAGCPELMKQEEAFFKALLKTESFSIKDDSVIAHTKDKEIVLVFSDSKMEQIQ